MIPPGLPAAATAADASVLLHLSDTHFGVEEPRAVEALLELTAQERPDAVLVSGDVTQRARPDEFDAAQRFLARLAVPHVMVVPGDHDIPRWDIPRRLLAPFAGFRRVFGDNLEPRLAAPFVWIASVVSARRSRWRHGALSADQVERTAQWLESAPPEALRVVMSHHPLAALRWHDEDDVARGAPSALARWSQAGVHLVLGGHTHTSYALPMAGAPGSAGTLWVAQAGSATSRRLYPGGRHSVNLLRRGASGTWRIEQWDRPPDGVRFSRSHWRQLGR